MSADNWAICPRCLNEAKINAGAFGYLLDPYKFQTFREDYEIYGAKDGIISVNYAGYCQVCNLSFSFKDERPFYDRHTVQT